MIPPWFHAILEALRLEGPRPEAVRGLSDEEWRKALALCDRSRMTLAAGRACQREMPEWVRERIEGNLRANRERITRLRMVFQEMQQRLLADGLEPVVLKGFSQHPDFISEAELRVQYDLDLYLPLAEAARARDALAAIGYVPLEEMEAFPTDHLPVMVRKTGWRWRGDFFDPEIPFPVDIHYRLWDEQTEGFRAPGWEEFWERRVRRDWDGLSYFALEGSDAVAYHVLHMLRHLLRGNLQLHHVYELACLLHRGPAVRMGSLQAIGFRLAHEWFPCNVPPEAAEEMERLPDPVKRWFDRYGKAPLEALFSPNKHELWLHLSLVEGAAARRKVLVRRLLPTNLPAHNDNAFVPEERITVGMRVWRLASLSAWLVRRAAHHLRALPSVLVHGAMWWLEPAYWRFLGAATLFNLGAFVFILLYNLYLLDAGYREDALGWISGAMTAGSIAGSLPAGRILNRLGLRTTLTASFAGIALVSVFRATLPGLASLIVSAFCAGTLFALYMVSIAPAVAQLAAPPARPRAFSLFFATGITTGIIGGFVGGRLPGWLGSKQLALLGACALIGLAAWPARKLPAHREAVSEKTYPTGRFIRRYLAAVGVWSLATGALNPFFNAWFARVIGASVEQIGTSFSAGQAAQAAAILLAPAVLKRMGPTGGIAAMQVATAAAMAALAALPAQTGLLVAAALLYALYMSFQYMSEPGLYSLLMDRTPDKQHSGASALNFLVIFSGQALAAAIAGSMIARLGYGTVMLAAAALALLAAILIRRIE